jgi:hypothetical protein
MEMIASKPPYAAIPHRQEAFSEAYIRAICAVAGCGIDKNSLDNDKIDFTVNCRVRGKVKTKPKLDIQAKCEISGAATTDLISYVLDIETYENLRDPTVAVPRVLVLLVSPADHACWIKQTEAELAIKHCAYWMSLVGLPESKNATSQTVHLPRHNVFSPNALHSMLEKISNGEPLR